MRRKAQLLAARPDLKIAELRGNVDTRLKKLPRDSLMRSFSPKQDYDVWVCRSDLTDSAKSIMLPAVGQGALGLEIRQGDSETRDALQCLLHVNSYRAALCERSMLRLVQGGCLAPIGAWARVEQGALHLDAVVLDVHGRNKIAASASAPLDEFEELGQLVASDLLSQGAGQLLADARE